MEPARAHRGYERKPFDKEGCTQCGQCLSECPVMRLPEEAAQREIVSLARYLEDAGYSCPSTDGVLKRCTSCFACNLVCPNDCRPANLMLDIWHAQYQREGLPVRARYFVPHSVPNFRTYVLDRLPAREKAAVEAWKRLDPAEAIFYPGCNIITSPYLTFSKLFEGMDIRGALEYCCGEMYFRMGLYDQVEQVAAKTTDYFRRLGVREVHLLCTAGLNLFRNVLPQFGADFAGIRFASFLKLLCGRIASGELPVVKPFDGKTVALQDSCHAKLLEPEYADGGPTDWPRKLLGLLGFEVVEPPCSRQSQLCCGIGSGFSHQAAYGKADLVRGQRRCLQNAQGPGADYIAAYCSGCLEMMSAGKYVSWPSKRVYHVIELVQEAVGETPSRRHRRIAFDFLKGTLLNQESGRERFFVPPIE